MLPMTDAGKLIDDGPARIVAVVVHAAQIHQKVKAQGRLGMLANLGDALGVSHGHGDFAPELEGLGDQVAKLLTKLAGEFKGGRHGKDVKSGFALQNLALGA